MNPIDTPGETRSIGKPANWDTATMGECGALSVCDVESAGCNMMVSTWAPTLEELVQMADGAPIHLGVYGQIHPVVSMWVGAQGTAPMLPMPQGRSGDFVKLFRTEHGQMLYFLGQTEDGDDAILIYGAPFEDGIQPSAKLSGYETTEAIWAAFERIDQAAAEDTAEKFRAIAKDIKG